MKINITKKSLKDVIRPLAIQYCDGYLGGFSDMVPGINPQPEISNNNVVYQTARKIAIATMTFAYSSAGIHGMQLYHDISMCCL